jgi:hypothetical protein
VDKDIDVVLVTCAQFPSLPADDRLLYDRIISNGALSVQIVVWDDPLFDWSRVTLVVLRSVRSHPLLHINIIHPHSLPSLIGVDRCNCNAILV